MKAFSIRKKMYILIVFFSISIAPVAQLYSQTANEAATPDTKFFQDTVSTLYFPAYPVVLSGEAVNHNSRLNSSDPVSSINAVDQPGTMASGTGAGTGSFSEITNGDPLSHVPVQVQVNTGKSVGSIPFESTTTQSGGIVYSIPIACTPGKNGLQPNIAIVYNSQGGNGIIGYGWNIGGLSSITRTTRNMYYNGKVASIQMDANDAFILDGIRLLKVGATTQFETEQGNIKVNPVTVNSETAYFTVYYPNGCVGTFGFTNNTTNKLFYPITKLTDNVGNSINFNYIFRNNHYYVDNIQYGWNNNAVAFGKIKFTYKTRTDKSFGYEKGIKITEDYLLDKITSYSSDIVIHTYSFSYVFDKVSFLNQVDCDNLNPLNFYYGYSDNVTASLNKSESTLMEYFGSTIPVIVNRGKFDFGTDDDALIIYPSLTNHAHYYKEATLFKHSVSYYISMYNSEQILLTYQSMAYASPLPTELTAGNGFMELSSGNFDGKPGDEVVKINNTVSNSKDRVTFSVYKPNLYTGLQLLYTRNYDLNNALQHYSSPLSFWPKKYFSADFNGDGKMEMLCISMDSPLGQSDKKSKCTLINLDSNVILFDANRFDYNIDYDEIVPMDYNGDGKAEVCYFNETGMHIYSFVYNGSSYDLVLESTYTSLTINTIKNFEVLFGDLNSDNKCDILVSPAKSYYSSTSVPVPVWAPRYCPYCRKEYPIISNTSQTCRFCSESITPSGRCFECGSILEETCNGVSTINMIGITNRCCPTHGQYISTQITEFVDKGKLWSVYSGTGNAAAPYVKGTISFLNITDSDIFKIQDVDQDGSGDIIRKSGNYVYVYPTRNGALNANISDILSTSLTSGSANVITSSIGHPGFSNFLLCIYNEKVTKINATRNESKQRLLTGSVNSLGVVNKNYYNQLNDGYGISNPSGQVYTVGNNASFPYQNYMGPLWVTSLQESFLNTMKISSLGYNYYNAIVHCQGLGFRGFEKITTYDLVNGYTNETIINPLNYGIPVKDNSTLRELTYQATASVATNKKLTIKVNSVTQVDKVKGTTVTSSYTYDTYANPLTVTVNYGGGITSTIRQTYFNSTATPYIIGQPLTKTVTNTRNGSQWLNRESVTYYSNRLPRTKTTYTGTGSLLKTGTIIWTYDSNGNLTSESAVPYNVTDSLKTYYTYDTDGRYLTTKKNAMNQVTTFSNYDKYGNACSIENFKGQETTNSFNEWGQPLSVVYPDGVTMSLATEWGGTGLYTITTTGTGKPATVVHYDALGREVRNTCQRFDGQWQKVDKVYDAKGRLQKASLPFRGAAATLWNTYSYDSYNRLLSLTEVSGRSNTWSYNGNSITQNSDGIVSTKNYDATGQLLSVTDPGGTITYSLRPDGQPGSITAPGNIVTSFHYDAYGRQDSIYDPSAGGRKYTEKYVNNLLVRTVKDANNKTITTNYDRFGRVTTISRPEFSTTYIYNSDGLLESEISTNGTSKTMKYDGYGRLDTIQENVPDNKYLKKEYTYTNGNIETIKYTSQSGLIGTEYMTYANGAVIEIKLNNTTSIWRLTGENDLGQPTGGETGPLGRTDAYNQYGVLTGSVAGAIKSFSYNFDVLNGNLLTRTNNKRNFTESFSYDALNRLSVVEGDSIVYGSNGNINYMPGVGTMAYKNTNKPYAITELTTESTAVPVREQEVSYTSFMRPGSITENDVNAAFTYNVAGERVKMSVTQNGAPLLTRYYISGQYETDVQTNTERLYLGGDPYTSPAVYVKEAGVWKLYYICSDHLGSITHVANADGTLKQELSYDAWGRLCDPATRVAYAPGTEPALFLGRGFTGHEYLPWFGLINMNARLYDPALGRFLSPDPYVQTPDFTQSFNRYSYCLNNPLTYADPSGERTLLGKFFHWVGEQTSEPWARGFLWMPTMLAVAPSEIMSLDALGCGSFISNYIRGGFSEGMKAIGNSIEINAQVFDPGTEKAGWGKDLLLRFTYEGLNTGLGSLAANLTNSFSNVDDVQFYRGVTVLKTGGEWGGITFGNYIIGDRDMEASPDNPLFQHEFGHFLQSKKSGWSYFFKYGIPSIFDVIWNSGYEHKFYWAERDANNIAFIYFNLQYSGYKGWDYIRHPLYNEDDQRNNSYPNFYHDRRTSESTLR